MSARIPSLLREPSTWAGAGLVAASVGQAFPDLHSLATIAAAAAGAVAMILREKGAGPG